MFCDLLSSFLLLNSVYLKSPCLLTFPPLNRGKFTWASRPRCEFISAEQNINVREAQFLDLNNPTHKVLLAIAQNAFWLLNEANLRSDSKEIRQRYIQLLIAKNLATHSGRLFRQEILSSILSVIPKNVFDLLKCELDPKKQANWLLRLLDNKQTFQSPVHHLLLMYFLGYTASDFFQLPIAQQKPFGQGPWPCLNLTCPKYGQLVIEKWEINPSKSGKGSPSAIFHCDCGFSYLRKADSKTPDNKYKIGKIISFGATWEARLRELNSNSDISLRAKARALDVDPATVKRRSANFYKSHSKNENSVDVENRRKIINERKAYFRQLWIEWKTNYPSLSITQLRKMCANVYSWLYRNDKIWLERHKPTKAKTRIVRNTVNWIERDVNFHRRVKLATTRLLMSTRQPIRLTISSICREAQILAIVQKHPEKLPRTMKFLNHVVESRENFAIRRICLAAQILKSQNMYPKRWQIVKTAGIERLQNNPRVKAAIQQVLNGS
jgi:hypothetical protein